MFIASAIGRLATIAPVPPGSRVPDSGLVGALVLHGLPRDGLGPRGLGGYPLSDLGSGILAT